MTTPGGSGRVRRMASPSTKPGPLRATLTFGLGAGTGTGGAGGTTGGVTRGATSPTPQWGTDILRPKSRRSPDHRTSPERASPSSPGFKDRSKASRHSPALGHPIKRTGSLDTIAAPYLKGEWPRPDPGVVGITPVVPAATTCHNYCDKCTQTPAEWEEIIPERRRRTSHKRSSSLGNGDALKKDAIKARFSKTTKEGRTNVVGTRTSPVQPSYSYGGAVISVQTKAVSIPHIPRQAARIRGSVEGPSQEIERLVWRHSGIEEESFTREPTPDGHRAPIAEMLRCGISIAATRSVDTQTPSGVCDENRLILEEEIPAHTLTPPSSHSSSNSSSRSHSESPGQHFYTIGMESPAPPQDQTSPVSKGDEDEEDQCEKTPKDSSSPDGTESPDPKSFLFVREPPDGCEKVKVTVEEPRKYMMMPEKDFYGPPLKETVQLCRIPSELSAFCPLLKPYVSQAADRAYISPETP